MLLHELTIPLFRHQKKTMIGLFHKTIAPLIAPATADGIKHRHIHYAWFFP
jgi:hypothetical protein